MSARLVLEDLSVVHAASRTTLVERLSLRLEPGQALCLLGESGSGKSLLAQAVMGSLPAGLHAAGRIVLDGEASAADDAAARRARWGRRLALLPQEPWTALDPTMPVRAQVAEVHRHVQGMGRTAAREAAQRALAGLGLAAQARQLPFTLSGGMAQRVAFAAATASEAPVLLADEPTKGLDAALRDQVIALLRTVLARGGAVLVITHDVALPRALGGQLAVMQAAQLVEHGQATQLLESPSQAYTRRLLAAEPARWPDPPAVQAPSPSQRATDLAGPLLQARGVGLRIGRRWLFEGIDLALHAGERVAVLGPSGSGKTTLGQILLGLQTPTEGAVQRRAGLAPQTVQKLYQDPLAAFAPRRRLGEAIDDLARRHRLDASAVPRWLERLRLAPTLLARLPHEVSGGELQRLALLRLLLLTPAVVFADEPTSRLDPVNQQETMALLVQTLADQGGALVLVTHDPDLARKVCQRHLLLASTGPALPHR